MRIWLPLLLLPLLTTGCEPEAGGPAPEAAPDSVVLRVAAYNIEDVRTADLDNPDHPRLKQAAAVLQHLRPDVLLVSEMTYDAAGANARRFAEAFLGVAQADSLEPLRLRAFTAPTNTGEASGFDLDNDGRIVTDFPPLAPPDPAGRPARQTAEERAYGNDAWGFGTFPGQYGMALFVRDDLDILEDAVRTFRLLPWSRMPGALVPTDSVTGDPFYDAAEWERFRLSSKSHWDVPVRLPGGAVLHVLASHPTPPAFDGAEQRNVRRNHDEIRFWADYLDGADYIVDDSSRAGGLPDDAFFVLLGDLNADPDEGSSFDDPVGRFLLAHPRIDGTAVPTALPEGRAAYPDLDPDDTAQWGLRVDYVLPSANLRVLRAGLLRPTAADSGAVDVSDHFPVFLDLAIPSRSTFNP